MNRRRRGFLLIEAMIATVVLAVAAAAVATLLASAAHASTVGREDAAAVVLADQLLEEIASRPLYPPVNVSLPTATPTAREGRLTVGMYANYADTTTALTTADGTDVTAAGPEYQRSVSVAYRSGPGGCTAAATEFALVTVTVTTPSGRSIAVSRLVGNVTLNS